jgi:hypothetical protein
MSKIYYCAECAKILTIILKTVPGQGVYRIVEPHECPPDMEEVPFAKKFAVPAAGKVVTVSEAKKLDFSFVSKLNKEIESSPMIEDKRDKEHRRKELTTSAPAGILHNVGVNLAPTSTNRDLTEPEDG